MQLTKIGLRNFCGFEDFTVELDNFTVLVGPNSGGKTTILRAVRLALEGFRSYFGGRETPNLNMVRNEWSYEFLSTARRCGFQNLQCCYYRRREEEEAVIELRLQSELGSVDLRVTTIRFDKLVMACRLNGVPLTNQAAGPPGTTLPGDQVVPDDTARLVVQQLYAFRPHYVIPPSTMSSGEPVLDYARFDRKLAEGELSETWQNQLHWLFEGQPPAKLVRVSDFLDKAIGGVQLRPPARNKASDSMIEIRYDEGDVAYDISAAGAGHRTVMTLASHVELSDTALLLIDEPESHLHSSVQRLIADYLLEQAMIGRQVIVSTHAPDIIDQVPLDSLIWIDRTAREGKRCEDTGKVLVDLGAVSHSQAIQFLGSDTLLCFEDQVDMRTLKALMQRLGKGGLLDRCRIELLHGYGDAKYLSGGLRALEALRVVKARAVMIRDADYTSFSGVSNPQREGNALVVQLPCKELENLLLLAPEAIAAAAHKEAERRAHVTQKEPCYPSPSEVQAKLEQLSQLPEIKDDVWLQAVAPRLRPATGGGVDPGQLKQVIEAFEQSWADTDWRLCRCPGKRVLSRIKDWLRAAPYNISLRTEAMFSQYKPGPELQNLFDEVERFINEPPP